MKGNIVIFGLKVFKGKTLTGKCKRVALMMGAIVVMHLQLLTNIWVIVKVFHCERNEPSCGSIRCKQEANCIVINNVLRQRILLIKQRVQYILLSAVVLLRFPCVHDIMYLFQKPVPSL